jgi:hypothetical protein
MVRNMAWWAERGGGAGKKGRRNEAREVLSRLLSLEEGAAAARAQRRDTLECRRSNRHKAQPAALLSRSDNTFEKAFLFTRWSNETRRQKTNKNNETSINAVASC